MVTVDAWAKVTLPHERELVASSFSGITLALGYLFGSRGRPQGGRRVSDIRNTLGIHRTMRLGEWWTVCVSCRSRWSATWGLEWPAGGGRQCRTASPRRPSAPTLSRSPGARRQERLERRRQRERLGPRGVADRLAADLVQDRQRHVDRPEVVVTLYLGPQYVHESPCVGRRGSHSLGIQLGENLERIATLPVSAAATAVACRVGRDLRERPASESARYHPLDRGERPV